MVDIAVPIRAAIIANTGITNLLAVYAGSPAVFTRRPVPADAPYPMLVISQNITAADEDGINDNRPIYTRDLIAYGQNDTPDHYKTVETIADKIRDLFHLNVRAITVPSWTVVLTSANGPTAGPTDDDTIVARVVSVKFRLASLAT